MLPIQLLQQSKSDLWLSSTSTVLARPHPQWHLYLWTAKRGDERQVFQQQVVKEWLHSQPKEFFYRSMCAFPKRWNTCMECNGDYIEKWSHSVPFMFNKFRDKKIFSVFIWLTLIVLWIFLDCGFSPAILAGDIMLCIHFFFIFQGGFLYSLPSLFVTGIIIWESCIYIKCTYYMRSHKTCGKLIE
jgi:hypothetical protein